MKRYTWRMKQEKVDILFLKIFLHNMLGFFPHKQDKKEMAF